MQLVEKVITIESIKNKKKSDEETNEAFVIMKTRKTDFLNVVKE